MTEQTKQYYGLELTEIQRMEVFKLLQELKEAGLLMDQENMGMFMATCFYRGFNEYKKDLTTDD